MRLIMNKKDEKSLLEQAKNFKGKICGVDAAVAYATNPKFLFEWCKDKKIRLTFYGREHNNEVAVKPPILRLFLDEKSDIFVCKLVKDHHAKVIWWHGFGVYIGSANLTNKAWEHNIEAGCFYDDNEITDKMKRDLCTLFESLDKKAKQLTEEIYDKMREREEWIKERKKEDEKFMKALPTKISRQQSFANYWNEIQKILMDDIGEQISQAKNKPSWVNGNIPLGIQVDRFLQMQLEAVGQKNVEVSFGKNQSRQKVALQEAINRWAKPTKEENKAHEERLNDVEYLRNTLKKEQLDKLTKAKFKEICSKLYALKNSIRFSKGIDKFVENAWENFENQSFAGERVKKLFTHILYGDSNKELSERLYEGDKDSNLKIPRFSISSLSELVGCVLSNDGFSPMTTRTIGAMRSLGYDVKMPK